jgi:hypothetical protein
MRASEKLNAKRVSTDMATTGGLNKFRAILRQTKHGRFVTILHSHLGNSWTATVENTAKWGSSIRSAER